MAEGWLAQKSPIRRVAVNTLCGEFDQERVYGIAWQSKEFSGGFVDFLLGRGGRHPR
jgi:hypothetical protein